jgi:hypothetical protein
VPARESKSFGILTGTDGDAFTLLLAPAGRGALGKLV